MLMSDLERLVWMYATENQKAKMEILVQKCKASPGRCLCRCVRPDASVAERAWQERRRVAGRCRCLLPFPLSLFNPLSLAFGGNRKTLLILYCTSWHHTLMQQSAETAATGWRDT